MTKEHALIDAQSRAERSGIIWNVIQIKRSFFTKTTYETVGNAHIEQHKSLYKSGHFKVIETFEPSEILEP